MGTRQREKKNIRDDHINNNYDNYAFADIETASELNKSFSFPLSSRATNEKKSNPIPFPYALLTFNSSMMFYLSQFGSWYLAIDLRQIITENQRVCFGDDPFDDQ